MAAVLEGVVVVEASAAADQEAVEAAEGLAGATPPAGHRSKGKRRTGRYARSLWRLASRTDR